MKTNALPANCDNWLMFMIKYKTKLDQATKAGFNSGEFIDFIESTVNQNSAVKSVEIYFDFAKARAFDELFERSLSRETLRAALCCMSLATPDIPDENTTEIKEFLIKILKASY